jgi:hypothetical protein
LITNSYFGKDKDKLIVDFNGVEIVIERKFLSAVQNDARARAPAPAMLQSCNQHVGKEYWDYAVEYAAYLKNRLPHSSLPKKCSLVEMHGHAASNHATTPTFGCLCYTKLHNKINKLDNQKIVILDIFKRAHFSLKLFEVRLNVNGYLCGLARIDFHFPSPNWFTPSRRDISSLSLNSFDIALNVIKRLSLVETEVGINAFNCSLGVASVKSTKT